MIITSLRRKIQLIFWVTLLLLLLLFIFSIKYDHAIIQERTEAQERAISNYLYTYYLKYGKIDRAYLDSQNVSLIKDKNLVVKIDKFFKQKDKYKHYAVEIYHLKRIILINNDRFKLLLENRNRASFPLKRVMIFTTIFILILLLYFWIMKSLKPLSTLKKQIKRFSHGDLEIDCRSDKNDEIAEVANEFHHAVTMIKELLHSRQLFLRAIMHELKTPIAKGRLVSEMLPNEKNKNRMHSIFERLNLLIDEFAKIEKITSKNFDLNLHSYKMSDLVEASIDILMIEHSSNLIDVAVVDDYEIKVDFELFTLTIKNLLDNGIKYSHNKKITINIHNHTLSISNEGVALNEPLEHYFKPFHTSKKGLGLGLYIVKSILDIHQMQLMYKYQENINVFTIYSLK